MTTPFQTTQTFVPTQIPGCQLWFDAADQTTFSYSSGTTISEWRDKSSNAYSVIQPTSGRQPSLTPGAQNRLPGIQFGSNLYLYQTSTSMPNFTTGGSTSVLMAARNASNNDSWNIINTIWFDSAGGSGTLRYHFSFNQNATDGTTLYTNGSLVGQVTSNAVAPSANAILGFTASATSQTIHTNGSTNSFTGTTLPDATGTSAFTFNDARNNVASANTMLFEMVGYNTQISVAQRQLLEGYLAWKWNLVAQLPADHPYKTTSILSLPPFQNAPRQKIATPVSVFQPPQLSGCTLWLDAADTSTITGSPLTTWRDKSGLANNATATVGPTQSSYSGLPVVSFNGSTQFMDSPNTVPRTTHTLIAVHRPVTITANFQGNTSLFRYQIPGPNYIVFPYMFGLTPRGYITSADGEGAGSIDYANSTLLDNSVTTAFNLIIAVISSGSQQIFKNGTQQNSDTEILTGTTSDSLTIGRYTPGLSEYYQGDVGEMIVYSGALNTTQRQQVEGYLAWKWGMVGTLPNGHPYKTPPLAPFSYAVRQTTQRYWSPLSIPGSALWLDGADTSSLTLAGNTVTSWNNKVPGGIATTTVSSPLLSGNYLNRIQTLRFNGNSITATLSTPVETGDYAMFAVWLTINGGTEAVLSIGPNGGPAAGLGYNGSYYNLYEWAQTDSQYVAGKNQYVLHSGTRVSGIKTVFYNGISGTPASGTLNLTNTTVYIGNGTGFPINGEIGEVILYQGTLTPAQRQQVEGYLAWKWGLQTNLPANHPYKRFPPSP